MKHIRKIMALLIVAAMFAAMGISAMATSITINSDAPKDAVDTTQYEYYQLFHAEVVKDGNTITAVTYYLADGTDDALRTLLDAVEVDGTDAFTFTQSADGTRWTVSSTITDGEKLADAVNTAAIKAKALSHDTFAQNDSGSVTATVAEQGYYLITSSLGTNLVLQTLDDVEITTKNDYITNTKTASKTNMEVGDHVTYTITVTIPASAKAGDEVTVHDTLDTEHLAILNSSGEIAASAADYAITAKTGESTAVTLSDGTLGTGETFAKKFTITSDMITNGSVVLTYDAELLSTAATDDGYVNEVFSNTSTYKTVPSNVEVYSFDFTLDKNFTNGQDSYAATFELRRDAADATTAIQFVSDATGYVKADSDDTGASKNLNVTHGTNINIRGLAAGTYYLVEIDTQSGYNLATDPIEVVIADTTSGTTVSHTVNENTSDTPVTVVNNTGTELPSTGGIGTTIFYVVGGILVAGAGVILITKRRLLKEQ